MNTEKNKIDYNRIKHAGPGFLPLIESKTEADVYYYATFGFSLTKEVIEKGKTGLGLPIMKCIAKDLYPSPQSIPESVISDMSLDELFGDSKRGVFAKMQGASEDNLEVTVYKLSPPDDK